MVISKKRSKHQLKVSCLDLLETFYNLIFLDWLHSLSPIQQCHFSPSKSLQHHHSISGQFAQCMQFTWRKNNHMTQRTYIHRRPCLTGMPLQANFKYEKVGVNSESNFCQWEKTPCRNTPRQSLTLHPILSSAVGCLSPVASPASVLASDWSVGVRLCKCSSPIGRSCHRCHDCHARFHPHVFNAALTNLGGWRNNQFVFYF